MQIFGGKNFEKPKSQTFENRKMFGFFKIFEKQKKSKKCFSIEKIFFRFIQSRDMVYVRSIKPKERVYNKFGWVLKIDIEKSWDFGFFAKNHRLFGICSEKPYLNVLQ